MLVKKFSSHSNNMVEIALLDKTMTPIQEKVKKVLISR